MLAGEPLGATMTRALDASAIVFVASSVGRDRGPNPNGGGGGRGGGGGGGGGGDGGGQVCLNWNNSRNCSLHPHETVCPKLHACIVYGKTGHTKNDCRVRKGAPNGSNAAAQRAQPAAPAVLAVSGGATVDP